LAGSGEGAAVPVFTEIAEFGEGSTIPVAWGDYDLDGDWDLAVGNYFGEQNYLHTNDGSGSFDSTAAFGRKSTFALAWGDYDNDGDPDLAVGNGLTGFSNNSRLITNLGDGTFSGAAQFGDRNTVALAWGDYDLDGDLDLAVGNGLLGAAEANYLYRNDGGGSFAELQAFGAGQSASLVWGDCDGDGDLDLAVGNGGFISAEPNSLYINNGDGTFTGRAEFGMGDTSCLVWGDADGDGDLDLAVANWNGGQNRLYLNDGSGNFSGQDAFGARDPNTMAWADCDHDGDLDLAVGNGDFGSADQNYLYENDGTGQFTEHAVLGLGSTDSFAWADVDGDGDLDLAAGNEHHPLQNYLYRNDGSHPGWIRLHLVGRFHDQGAGWSNRDAIGAKVSVYETGHIGDASHRLGFREVEAHGGFAAQNAIDLHFGVGAFGTVEVRIEWPGSNGSRIVQDVTGLSAGTVHTVVESDGSTSAANPVHGSAAFEARPNPMRTGTWILLGRRLARADRFTVFDVAGRAIRELPAADSGTGVRAYWDGRAEDGIPVPGGVYFVKVTGESGERSLRIVAIR
jgi:hypothetical protein